MPVQILVGMSWFSVDRSDKLPIYLLDHDIQKRQSSFHLDFVGERDAGVDRVEEIHEQSQLFLRPVDQKENVVDVTFFLSPKCRFGRRGRVASFTRLRATRATSSTSARQGNVFMKG